MRLSAGIVLALTLTLAAAGCSGPPPEVHPGPESEVSASPSPSPGRPPLAREVPGVVTEALLTAWAQDIADLLALGEIRAAETALTSMRAVAYNCTLTAAAGDKPTLRAALAAMQRVAAVFRRLDPQALLGFAVAQEEGDWGTVWIRAECGGQHPIPSRQTSR